MKNRINLLTKQKNYFQFDLYLHKLRLVSYASLVLFFAIVLIFFLLLQNQKSRLDTLLIEKQSLLNYFIQNQEYEAELVYFSKKNNQLQEYYKEDFRNLLLPYYKLLNETLKIATGAALNTVSLGKDRSVQFTVSFEHYSSFYDFFEFVESNDFLNNFEELSLSNFSISETAQTNYNLGFSGKLTTLNETQN